MTVHGSAAVRPWCDEKAFQDDRAASLTGVCHLCQSKLVVLESILQCWQDEGVMHRITNLSTTRDWTSKLIPRHLHLTGQPTGAGDGWCSDPTSRWRSSRPCPNISSRPVPPETGLAGVFMRAQQQDSKRLGRGGLLHGEEVFQRCREQDPLSRTGLLGVRCWS